MPFYKLLIPAQEVDNHLFWCNFPIGNFSQGCREHYGGYEALSKIKGFDISKYLGINKIKTLRNCVQPHLGLHILNESKRDLQGDLFK